MRHFERKHWIIAGGIVVVIAMSALNAPRNSALPPDPSPSAKISAEPTPAYESAVTRDDLIFNSVTRAQVHFGKDLEETSGRLLDTFTYSINGGWTPTDTRSAHVKDAYVVEIVVDYPKMARGFFIDSCGEKTKPRRCSQDELATKIADYTERPCARLGGQYGLGHFSFYDAGGREMYKTDKWGGQSVILCESKGDEVRALLGPVVEQPASVRLSDSGPTIPLKSPSPSR